MSGSIQTILSPVAVQQFTDNDGNLLAGGNLFVYAAGTTTKQSAYTDSTGDTALPNPIVLNTRGEVAPSATGTSCGLWLNAALSYKLVLAPAGSSDPPTAPIWTVDNINSQAPVIAGQSWQEIAVYNVTPTAAFSFALPPGYRRYRVTLYQVFVSTNEAYITLQFSSNGGVSYYGSGYNYVIPDLDSTGTSGNAVSASADNIPVTTTLPAPPSGGNTWDGGFEIFPGAIAFMPRVSNGFGYGYSSTGHYVWLALGGGWLGTAVVMNYAQLAATSGTWSGQMVLEGLP